MTAMRAKVKITNIAAYPTAGPATQETLTFNFPSKDGAYPADGSDEDQSFARYSPSGALSLTVANPALVGQFVVGDTFYLDFKPVAPKLPVYKSHKKVRALALSDVVINNDTGAAWLTPMDTGYAPFDAPAGWASRFHGSDDDCGYFVVYEDGYASWSPSRAFEDGYTAV